MSSRRVHNVAVINRDFRKLHKEKHGPRKEEHRKTQAARAFVLTAFLTYSK